MNIEQQKEKECLAKINKDQATLLEVKKSGKWSQWVYKIQCSKGHVVERPYRRIKHNAHVCNICFPNKQDVSKRFQEEVLSKKLEKKFLALEKPYTTKEKKLHVRCLKCEYQFSVSTNWFVTSDQQTYCYKCQGRVIDNSLLESTVKQYWKILDRQVSQHGHLGSKGKLKLECKTCQYTCELEYRHAANKVCKQCASDPNISKVVKGVIYKIICEPSKKVYIGQTIQKFKERIHGHFRKSQDYNNPAYHTKLGAAMRKYKKSDFSFEILHYDVPWNKLDELEILEIKNHNSYHDGLNSTEGGNIGHRNAMEARKRFNKILKNKREREVKQKAKQERRALTNFEKNLEKDIKTFQKESRNKNSYKDLQEHVNRTIGGTKRPSIQSQYVGVCWDTGNKKWRAAIKHQGKKIYIGLFGDEVEAAKAYDKMCIQLRGPRAKTNF